MGTYTHVYTHGCVCACVCVPNNQLKPHLPLARHARTCKETGNRSTLPACVQCQWVWPLFGAPSAGPSHRISSHCTTQPTGWSHWACASLHPMTNQICFVVFTQDSFAASPAWTHTQTHAYTQAHTHMHSESINITVRNSGAASGNHSVNVNVNLRLVACFSSSVNSVSVPWLL